MSNHKLSSAVALLGLFLCFIAFSHDYEVFDEDLDPYVDTQGGLGSRFKGTQFGGYDLGLKYNVLSPYKDALGLSFGVSYASRQRSRLDGAKTNQDWVSVGAFMQKNYLDNTVAMAFSPKVSYKRRNTPGGSEQELALDISAGIAHRLSPGWFAGLEFRHQSGYLNPYTDEGFNPELQTTNVSLSDFSFSVGSQQQRANYFGYQFEGQGRAPGVNNSDGRNWGKHERWNFGLIVGWEFGRDNGSNDFDLGDFEF